MPSELSEQRFREVFCHLDNRAIRSKTQLLADGRGKILRTASLLALGSAVPILSTDVLSVVGGFLKYPKVVDSGLVNWIPIQLCSNDRIPCRGLYRGGGRILVSPIKSPESSAQS